MDKKIIALIACASIILSGGFFSAGYFLSNKQPSKKEVNKKEETEKPKEGKDVKTKMQELINDNVFYKKSKITLSIPVDRPTTQITMETVLQEIDHNVEKGEQGILNKFTNTLADDVKIVVFVGYFNKGIAQQILKLLSNNGYLTNIAQAKDNDDVMIFCGPLENVNKAENTLKWLKSNDFVEARIIYTQEQHINTFKINKYNQHTKFASKIDNVQNQPKQLQKTNNKSINNNDLDYKYSQQDNKGSKNNTEYDSRNQKNKELGNEQDSNTDDEKVSNNNDENSSNYNDYNHDENDYEN